MSYSTLPIADSFLKCAKKIEAEFAHADSLVLLNGDSLSGRTSLCEQLINALDGRYTTVFIPCKDDSSLETLRTLVLQQISQGKAFDSSKPLWQAFNELSVPVREKFLIVADDLDRAIDDFVEELFELFKKYLGSNRFSMLLTAHPLWAETKMTKLSGRIGYVQYAVPSLSMDETLEISKQIFESANLSRVYKSIESKLPKAYEKCSGNVGKIIKLTEILMSDPIEATSKNTETPVEIKPDVLKKKKRSSSAVFISIICIVIVIACLIPVFLGSNVTEKVFGSDSAAETESAQTVGKADSSGAVKDSVNNSLSEDPLAVSAGAVTDINAKGPKGDGKNSVSDDGELLPKVSEGIEAETV
ncbi:MAG: AAA family ATPase, partial [Succinivibrio sp.]